MMDLEDQKQLMSMNHTIWSLLTQGQNRLESTFSDQTPELRNSQSDQLRQIA
jgi:hypothetical protein